ncbi:MAG: cell division protein FtsA [Acidobacteriota bacterium]
MSKNREHVVGLDIGTSNIRVVIAAAGEDGGLDVVGIGRSASKGLRRGVVVNLDATVEAIRGAVEEAELMAGLPVTAAHVGVAGVHVKGLNSRGVVAVARKDQRITDDEIDRVLDAAKAIQVPRDREILHVLPQDFTVDDQDGVADPAGMQGARLEADVHVVTAGLTATQNLITCANRAGIEVESLALESLASGECVLNDDEKELGVALVDIGGGTTDLAVYERGALWHVATLPVGGDHFTNDIAVGLRTPIPEAEALKKRHGHALSALLPDDASVDVPSVGGRAPRTLSLQVLAEIIQPRAEEIFGLVREELDRAGYGKSVHSGVVLTGGAVNMPGTVEVAEQVFDLPVRRGMPKGIGGLVDVVATPAFATAVGLTLWGRSRQQGARPAATGFSLGRVGNRFKEWLAEIFVPAAAVGGRRGR